MQIHVCEERVPTRYVHVQKNELRNEVMYLYTHSYAYVYVCVHVQRWTSTGSGSKAAYATHRQ